ncbi:MAG: Zn-ribbon domain-containing OB-fold protein [Candidatus Thorarchaeota archaeon]|nr:Zn-ribbon domain-containing OB-fold protein [Candidatus Thorarchaeota archaeon]
MVDDKRMHKIPDEVEYTDKHSDDFRGDVREHGFQFVGYDWAPEEEQFKIYLHYDQLYYWKLAELSKMGKGFLDGELWGTKCPKCGDKFFPPRVNCWNLDCNLEKTEWIKLKPEGHVHTFTIAGWSGKSSLKRLPFVLAYVVIDGCQTAVANELRGIDPWDAEFGMPVKVVWADPKDRRGTITDFWFEPADGWKPSPMNPEKERIKELCQPVYEWVKTLK